MPVGAAAPPPPVITDAVALGPPPLAAELGAPTWPAPLALPELSLPQPSTQAASTIDVRMRDRTVLTARGEMKRPRRVQLSTHGAGDPY
jgi:hypothetical protein